ncbi:sugar kinase [Enterococcus sp. LJL90]
MGKVLTIGEPMAMFIAQTPEKLKHVKSFDRYVAGAEVNVSVGLVRLEHEVTYVTELGQDPFGEHIVEFLEAEDIDTSLIEINPEYPTGFQLKNKDSKNDPEVVYFRKGSAAYHMGIERAAEIDFSDIDIFHVTGILMALNDGTYELMEGLIQKAKAQNTIITFDPNLRPTLWGSRELMTERINHIAEYADYVLPGIGEGFILTGRTEPDEIADFYLDLGAKAVIIKLGSKGAYAKWRDLAGDHILTQAGFRVEAVDTVGAGDGFAVGIVSGLLEGLPMKELLVRANAIGAIQVSHISDNENLPTREQLADFIQNHPE